MAQKRMIDKKISLSEKLSDLPLGAQLLYTWMIPHADDFGLLQGSPRTLKAQVMPMADVTTKEVESWVTQMLELHLIKQFQYKGKNFYYVCDFEKNQNLRHDMQPYTVLPIELGKDYQENWKKCSELVQKNAGVSFDVTTSAEIGTEVKIREEKISNIPAESRENNKKIEKKDREYTDDPLVEYCRTRQGIEKRFVNYGKQLQALRKIRETEYSEDDIRFVIDEMADETYWQENPFDMSDVANQMHKYMNRTVMFDEKKGGNKYQKY